MNSSNKYEALKCIHFLMLFFCVCHIITIIMCHAWEGWRPCHKSYLFLKCIFRPNINKKQRRTYLIQDKYIDVPSGDTVPRKQFKQETTRLVQNSVVWVCEARLQVFEAANAMRLYQENSAVQMRIHLDNLFAYVCLQTASKYEDVKGLKFSWCTKMVMAVTSFLQYLHIPLQKKNVLLSFIFVRNFLVWLVQLPEQDHMCKCCLFQPGVFMSDCRVCDGVRCSMSNECHKLLK